jgi:hypothetical protein
VVDAALPVHLQLGVQKEGVNPVLISSTPQALAHLLWYRVYLWTYSTKKKSSKTNNSFVIEPMSKNLQKPTTIVLK